MKHAKAIELLELLGEENVAAWAPLECYAALYEQGWDWDGHEWNEMPV